MFDHTRLQAALDEIRSKRIYGVAHLGVSAKTAVLEAAPDFGLFVDATAYFSIDRERARRVLCTVLHRDLAYSVECMPLEDATRLADAVLECTEGNEPRYFTNGGFDLPETRLASTVTPGGAWTSVTDATFDTGVLIVTAQGSACIWFEDED